MRAKRTWLGLAGGLLTAAMLTACGGAAQPARTATTSGARGSPGTSGTTSSASSLAPLAPGASNLCSTAPTDPKLTVVLNNPGKPTVDSSYAGLQIINEDAAGSDGPFTITPIDGQTAVEPLAGKGTNGPFNWGELYFSANGAVPASVQNVELCMEVYDALAGQVFSADFSGNNPSGPVNGAYDAAPEAYLSTGTDKWYTVSFNFSGIAFQSGGNGIGKENGSADFRVDLQPPLKQGAVAFARAWLVTKAVPSTPSLSAPPGQSAAKPLSGKAPAATTATTTTTTASASEATTVAPGVPVLTLATVSTTPTISSFNGDCSALGLPSGGKGSFATKVTAGGYTEATTFWVAATASDLIYCAQIQTPTISATATGAGASTWTGDDMEFWLAPTNDRASIRMPDTYQVLFNPLGGWNNSSGTGISASPFNFSWKSNTQFKAVEQKSGGKLTGWAVLAELPWSSVGLSAAPASGHLLGFNTGGCVGAGCQQTTDWIPTLNLQNWHTPSLWGELKVQ